MESLVQETLHLAAKWREVIAAATSSNAKAGVLGTMAREAADSQPREVQELLVFASHILGLDRDQLARAQGKVRPVH
jgi:hypothetical protein